MNEQFRLQTMLGTYYSVKSKEIRLLQGMFMGAGHNVEAEWYDEQENKWSRL